MQIAEIAFFILVGFGGSTLRTLIKHREKMSEIKSTSNATLVSDSLSELQQLRDEVARLRDTTTQYDLSIDHHLEELDQRLRSIENRRTSYVAPAENEREQQLNIPKS